MLLLPFISFMICGWWIISTAYEMLIWCYSVKMLFSQKLSRIFRIRKHATATQQLRVRPFIELGDDKAHFGGRFPQKLYSQIFLHLLFVKKMIFLQLLFVNYLFTASLCKEGFLFSAPFVEKIIFFSASLRKENQLCSS